MKTLIGCLAMLAGVLVAVPTAAAGYPCGGYQPYYPPVYIPPTYYPPTTYTQYIPVAVQPYQALPQYGSSYNSNGLKDEIDKQEGLLRLRLLEKQIAALAAPPAPATAPPQQQYSYVPPAPAPQEAPPEYAPPRRATYAPPAAPSYAPPAQECQTCQQKAPPTGYVPQQETAPQRAPAYAPRQQAPRYQQPAPEDDEIAYAQPLRQQRAPAVSRGQVVGQNACARCHTPSVADEFGGGHVFFKDDAGTGWTLRPSQVKRVLDSIEAGRMPPKDSGITLTPADRSSLKTLLQRLGTKQAVARREE